MANHILDDKQYNKAFLVSFNQNSLDELKCLINTIGIKPVGDIVLTERKPDPAYLITKGRLNKIKQQTERLEVKTVIFDSELGPRQYRNIEEIFKCTIVDRTELIMRIFEEHAKTKQAKLQIEIARLRYLMPRLRSMWTHFSRIKGGIGLRGGTGEQQLEIDRRRAEDRLNQLKNRLKEISDCIDREIETRKECFNVSLVGYTNVGKSTLLNYLTGSEVLIDDRLFATLDTTTRRMKAVDGAPILVTDTVGFINNLPHQLVASFEATLKEAKQADYLVYLIDISGDINQQIEVIDKVLAELNIEGKERLLVFNKIDKIRERVYIGSLKQVYPEGIFISLKKGIGLKKLVARIVKESRKHFKRVDLISEFF